MAKTTSKDAPEARITFKIDEDLKADFFRAARANFTDPSKLLRQYCAQYAGKYKDLGTANT